MSQDAFLYVYDAVVGGFVPAQGYQGSLNSFSSATACKVITPSDTGTEDFKALWIGSIAGGQTLTMLGADGNGVVFTGVPVGILPVAGIRVLSTGTTVSGIVGLQW